MAMYKKELYKKYRDRGWTYQRVGDKFEVSRQAVQQVLASISSPRVSKYGVSIKLMGRGYLRETVRIRDNYTCQICGKAWKEGQRRLDVHHLDENLEGNVGRKYENNKDMSRMITLCHKCHMGLPHIKRKIGRKKLSTN